MAFDTTVEALDVQRQVWRRLGPTGRVRTVFEMSEAMHRITLDGIAARHPDADADERLRLLIHRVHGVDPDRVSS